MLKAPQTKEEFTDKIDEMKVVIWETANGKKYERPILEANPRVLRTYGFFKVGRELAKKLIEDEKKKGQIEEEKFDNLLKDIDVSF